MTEAWIDYLFMDNPSYFFQLDFRSSISSQFQILTTLCHNSRQAVLNALTSFATTQIVIPAMLSIKAFNSQVELLVSGSQSTLLDEQQRTSHMIRLFNQGYQFPSALFTNYIYDIPPTALQNEGIQSVYFLQ